MRERVCVCVLSVLVLRVEDVSETKYPFANI